MIKGVLVLGIILLLNFVGIGFYTKGFFLTRFEILTKSTCESPLELDFDNKNIDKNILYKFINNEKQLLNEEIDEYYVNKSTNTDNFETYENLEKAGCWSENKYDKIIWIVIDALRFDFVYNLEENEKIENEEKKYFKDAFLIIRELLEGEESQYKSKLFKFLSESPTVTMQRLKALTTGTIPTFIDISDIKFESSAIKEDNLIDQMIHAYPSTRSSTQIDAMQQNNAKIEPTVQEKAAREGVAKRKVFLGDDTWIQLYSSEKWEKAYAYESFNTKDIHTVDTGIISNIFNEIDESQMIIAHFLGVDHIGHRYGSNHPVIFDKLQQLDQFVRKIIEKMEKIKEEKGEEVLLIIMSDHGMTDDGNHGGSTSEEISSVLFFHSTKHLISPHFHALAKEKNPEKIKNVNQINFVSSFALLNGIPIPFANLGNFISELFIDFPSYYFLSLENFSEFLNDKISTKNQLKIVKNNLLEINKNYQLNSYQILNYLMNYSNISSEIDREVLIFYENQFNQLKLNFFDILQNEKMQIKDKLVEIYKINQNYENHLNDIQNFCRNQWGEFNEFFMIYGILLLLSSSILIVFFAFFPNLESLKNIKDIKNFNFSVENLFITGFGILLIILHGISQFSNSFIELEEALIRFLLISFFFFDFLINIFHNTEKSKKKNTNKIGTIFLVIFLIKLSSFTGRGRHESYFLQELNIFQNFLDISKLFFPIFFAFFIFNYFFQFSLPENKNKNKIKWQLLRRVMTLFDLIKLLSVSCYWLIGHYSILLDHFPHFLILLPRVVYITSIFQLLLIFLFREIHFFVGFRWFFGSEMFYSGKNQRLPTKKNKKDKKGILSSPERVPISSKLENSYFFGFFIQFTKIIWFVLALVSGFSGCFALLILLIQFLCFFKYLIYVRSSSPSPLPSFQFSEGVFLSFMSLQFLFATGHHWQFNYLQFESAFIGFDNFNWLIGASLMLLNTFSSPILFIFLLPLFIPFRSPLSPRSSSLSPSSVFLNVLLKYEFLFNWSVFLTLVFVFIEKRHLMVWRVFAPKFLLSSVFLLFINLACILCYFFVLLVSRRSSATKQHRHAE